MENTKPETWHIMLILPPKVYKKQRYVDRFRDVIRLRMPWVSVYYGVVFEDKRATILYIK